MNSIKVLSVLLPLVFLRISKAEQLQSQKNLTNAFGNYNVIVQRSQNVTGRELLCSGALISYQQVLTVAHCFYNASGNPLDKKYFLVMVGDLAEINANTIELPIKDIIVHPEYLTTNRFNDLAIVILEKEIEINTTNVVPIGLATYNIPVGLPCIISTWISYYQSWYFSEELQEIPVTIFPENACNEDVLLPDSEKRIICTYGNETTLETTYFLSGTPLVCNNVLTGLSYQTIRTNSPISKEGFININYYWSWIRESAGSREVSYAVYNLLFFTIYNVYWLQRILF